MANTIATTVYREKYFKDNIDVALRRALIVEKICTVDRSDSYLIKNPYGSTPTAVVQPLSGTYAAADFTTTNDNLTVAEEVLISEHIMDYQEVLTHFNVMASRLDQLMFYAAAAIDKFVLNVITEAGTGAYTTPVGGFTTASNVVTILANLISKVSGYGGVGTGHFLVVENTDLPGIVAAQANSGFNYADSALNNGFLTNMMGVDIYVTRSGTFTSETQGGQTWTNSGQRCFGVKGVATYASPRGIRYEEKPVSGKTGKEVVVIGYVGAKVWNQKTDLIVDITLA